MDCYFSSKILASSNSERLEEYLGNYKIPFNSKGAFGASGKFCIDGQFSCELELAARSLQELSDGLKSEGFPHIIWLDDEDSILYKTYSFYWPHDDYT